MNRILVAAVGLVLCTGLWAQDEGEAEHKALMKTIGPTQGSLRKNLAAKNGEGAAADAKKLNEIFAKVHDFWLKKKIDNATKFATDAQNGFKDVSQHATDGKFDEAQASLKMAMGTCSGCHSAYREKLEDGSYKIKYQ